MNGVAFASDTRDQFLDESIGAIDEGFIQLEEVFSLIS